MNSGLNEYESLVNTTGNEYINQDLEALEVQIIALQVEEKRNYKLDGSKQMDNGYTPTNDYDLITLKFFLEHNIITMSFLRTDGGNAMLANITMESTNAIDINGCRAISNQNSESKVNYQTFDYRTILQNGYYNGNTVNDWVGNNSIVISHKDGKIIINEAIIDFSNNQLVNINQINNITAAEIATLSGSNTSTTLQTQIDNGMTEIGNLTAEVLNLDNEVKTLQNTVIVKGYNVLENDGLNILAHFPIDLKSSTGATSLKGHVNLGEHQYTTNSYGQFIGFTSDWGTTFTATQNQTATSGGQFSVDHTPGITLKSYNIFNNIEYGHISNECKDFTKTVHNNELQTITGTKTVNITGDYNLTSNIYDIKSNSLTLTANTGPIDFKAPNGHFHVDAKDVNLVSNDQVEIESVNDILLTSTAGNVVLLPTIGNINLISNKDVQIQGLNKLDMTATNGDTTIGGNNIIVSSNQLTEIKGFSQIKIETLGLVDIIGDGSVIVKSDNGYTIIEGPNIEFKSPNNKLLFVVNNIYRDISKYLNFYQARSQNAITDIQSNTIEVTNLIATGFDFYNAKHNWNYPWKIYTDQVSGITYQFGSQIGNDYKYGFYNLPRSKYVLKTDIDLKYLVNPSNKGLVLFRWVLYEIPTNVILDSSRYFICGDSSGSDSWGYGSVSSEWTFDTSFIPDNQLYKVNLEYQGTNSSGSTTFYVVPDITVTLRGIDF